MPNTKTGKNRIVLFYLVFWVKILRTLKTLKKHCLTTGRFYVTSGTGGAVGGVAGLAHAQKQALVSVTRYIKLPVPAPNFEVRILKIANI